MATSWAWQALELFSEVAKGEGPEEPSTNRPRHLRGVSEVSRSMIDLLTDLMHLCDEPLTPDFEHFLM
jgi:hypothetical protein